MVTGIGMETSGCGTSLIEMLQNYLEEDWVLFESICPPKNVDTRWDQFRVRFSRKLCDD